MAKRGTLYRCHLFSFAGPQTEGVHSRWTKDLGAIGDREVLAGEVVELFVTIDGQRLSRPPHRIRLDILEEDFLLSGGRDDFIVSYLGTDVRPTDAGPPAAHKRTTHVTLTENGSLERTIRAFRRNRPTEFMDHILVIEDLVVTPTYHVVAWWQAQRLEDYLNSEFYFIVNVDDHFEDQSQEILDVTARPVATPEIGPTVFTIPLREEDPPTPEVGLDPLLDRAPGVAADSVAAELLSQPAPEPPVAGGPGRGGPGEPAAFSGAEQPDATVGEASAPPWPWPHPAGPASDDGVEFRASPFEDRLVAIFSNWNALNVRSDPTVPRSTRSTLTTPRLHARYAVSYDLRRALRWGQLLFGSVAFVILEGPIQRGRSAYWVLRCDTALELKAVQDPRPGPRVAGRDLVGLRARYFAVDFRAEHDLFIYRAIATADDGLIFPQHAPAIYHEFFRELDARTVDAHEEGVNDAERAKPLVFRRIEHAKRTDLEVAATLLADLDAHAFELLTEAERIEYITILVKATTLARQEVALIEVLKSIPTGERAQLDRIVQKLKVVRIFDQLINDLDSNLWSLLVVIGERFGQDLPFDAVLLYELLSDAGLTELGRPILPLIPGIRVSPDGFTITTDYVAELETAAQAFLQFVVSSFEGIAMLITEPGKVIEGVGQLVRLAVMVQLSLPPYNYEPAQDYVAAIWNAMAAKVVFALKGVRILGASEAVSRRVRWAILWEAISMVVGVGEVRAALGALRIADRAQTVGRLARVLGRGQQALNKLDRLAILFGRAGLPGGQDNVFRLISNLPADDLGRLQRALDDVDLDAVQDLDQLVQRYPNSNAVGAIAHVRPRIEALALLEHKVGRPLTAEGVEGFQTLLTKSALDNRQLATLLESLPDANVEPFLSAVQRLPDQFFAGPGSRNDFPFLLEVGARPAAARLIVEEGHDLFAALYRHADGNMALVDLDIGSLEIVRRQLLSAEGGDEVPRFLARWMADDPAALRRVRDARRAFGLTGSADAQAADLATLAFAAQNDAQFGGHLANLRARLGALGKTPAEITLLERRMRAYRRADQLDLGGSIPNMSAAERLVFDRIDADAWLTLFDYGRRRVGAFRSSNPKSRNGAIFAFKGVIAEEVFVTTRAFSEVMRRARLRARQEGYPLDAVAFVRGTRGALVNNVRVTGTGELTDGLIIAMRGDQVRILSVVESKSPSNVAALLSGGDEYFGQIVMDYERLAELPTTINGRRYDPDDLIFGHRATEWVAVTPSGSALPSRLVDRLGTGLNFRHYLNVVRDEVLNRVAERILDLLSRP